MRFIKQKDTSDCAVASLMCIIKYYKGNVQYDKLRNMMKCNKDGVSAYDLIKTANSIGFEAYGLKCEYSDLCGINLPTIAHTIVKKVYKHYVVIEKVGEKIRVMDPYFGKKTYTKEEFIKIWTGVIVVLNPKSVINEDKKSNIYLEIILKYKSKIVVISILSLITIFITILSTYYFKTLIDNINISKKIYIIFSLIIVLKFILEYITNIMIIKNDINIDKDLTLKTIYNMLSLKQQYFINRQKGDILSRINSIENIKQLLFKIPIMFFMHLCIIIICIFILSSINKRLLLISLSIVLIYFILYVLFYKKNKNYIKTVNEEKGYINGLISEVIDCSNNINNREIVNNNYNNIKDSYNKYLDMNYKFNELYNFEYILKNFFLLLLTNFVLYFGVKINLSISNIVLFYSILIMFIDSFKGIFEMEEEFTTGLVSINRLKEISNDNNNYGYYSNRISRIDIKNLCFSYKNDEYIINNLNIIFNRGDKIFVKGESGVGKTTLFSIIQGIFECDSGSIIFDNKDIKLWNNNCIEENISYGNLDLKIYKGTLLSNIGSDINRVNMVLNITNLLKETNYIVEEDGTNLSFGEKSKLILCRLLYKESSVLIIDELLNNLEVEEEQKILNSIFNCYRDRIIIFTSHKNIDYSLFDKVLILKKGGDYEIK